LLRFIALFFAPWDRVAALFIFWPNSALSDSDD